MRLDRSTRRGHQVRLLLLACAPLLLIGAQQAASRTAVDFRVLYDTHRWFDLREAVRSNDAPAFFRGVVASAFNDPERAIKDLRQTIRSAPTSAQAYEAGEILVYIYWRAGQYRQALSQLDALANVRPQAADVKEFRKLFAALAQFPEQSVLGRRYSKLRYTVNSGNFSIPVTINGQSAFYAVDTGANWPVISGAEARRRKLRIAEARGSVGGLTSRSAEVGDVAMAEDLTVGSVRLRNVSFLVIPDDRFSDIPAEQRGVLGLPVLLQLQALRWSSDGTFEIALPMTRSVPSRPNVYFDGAMPVTQVGCGDRKLDFALDTGAVQTYLYPRFASEFATLLKDSGRAATTRNVGAGGVVDLESIILPDLRLSVGGFATMLRPAPVIPKDIGSQWHYGNLGMDLLSQAHVVTLDFRSMTLALR